MKKIKQEKLKGNIYLGLGDTIQMECDGEVLSKSEIKDSYVIDETLIFEVEKGDFNLDKEGIGGAFLGKKVKED